MSSTYISASLRRAVIQRAKARCEYCGKPQHCFARHEIDHVIAEKHRGKTELSNLAFTCFECNRYKGSDIASVDPQTEEITPLFNPRTQKWRDHFRYMNGFIFPLTAEGRVTELLLRLNDHKRVAERLALKVRL